jgi:DNA-binding MarR family transcriptional regulator
MKQTVQTPETRRTAASAPPKASGRVPAERDLCQDVVVALRRISRASDLHSKHLAKVSGLTVPQAIVLQAIRTLGEVTTGRLAGHVELSQATLTVILDRIEQRGLIERYRSAADRRVVHTRLTADGQALLRCAPPLLDQRFTDAFRALEPQERLRIVRNLEQVASMMGVERLGDLALLEPETPAPER